MRTWLLVLSAFWFILLNPMGAKSASVSDPAVRVFSTRGLVLALQPGKQIVVIRHGAISNYMDAMTMPFKVKDPAQFKGLQRGSEINFELHVGADESWVANISQTGFTSLPPAAVDADIPPGNATIPVPHPRNDLLRYAFTNELGQPVTLSDFPGQALAITFFYTRCPLPDYCPRLSKNFAEASQQLEALPHGPANWHFLSISFDPEFDSPEILQAYGRLYHADSAHWSFLTGPKDKIRELARGCGVTMQDADGTINHNFRTLIIDASGHLQMVFPTGGDLSSEIVSEIIKGSSVTNAVLAQNRNR